MENRGEPVGYTCYFCLINFETKKCPRCRKKGSPLYKDQVLERPRNNPTDIDGFFKKRK